MATQKEVLEAFMSGVGPKSARYLHWTENEKDSGRSLWYSNPDYTRVVMRIAVRWGDAATGCMLTNLNEVSADLRTSLNVASRGTMGRVRRISSPLSGEGGIDPYFTAWFGAE